MLEKLHIKSVATHKCANDNKTPFKQNENEINQQKQKKTKIHRHLFMHSTQSNNSCCFHIAKQTATAVVTK